MASGVIQKFASGKDSGWLEITGTSQNSYPFTGTIYYRRLGDIIGVFAKNLQLKSQLAAKNTVTLCDLPGSTFFPPSSREIIPGCFINSGSVSLRPLAMRITDDGHIILFSNNNEAVPANVNIYFSGFGFAGYGWSS